MGDKEKGRIVLPRLLREVPIVEGGNHGLAGAGGSDNQVPVMMPQVPLCLKPVQDLLLVGIGFHIGKVEMGGLLPGLSLGEDRAAQLLPIRLAPRVGLELTLVPVGEERALDLCHRFLLILPRQLDVPFQAAGQGGI